MNLLLRAVFRQLRAHPWATATLLVGVTVALASVVAVHLLTERIARELDQAWPASFAGLTHAVRASAMTEDDYFALRNRWRAGDVTVGTSGAGGTESGAAGSGAGGAMTTDTGGAGMAGAADPGRGGIEALTPMIERQVSDGSRDFQLFAFDPVAVPATAGLAMAAPSLLTGDRVLAHAGTGLAVGQTLALTDGHGTLEVEVVDLFGDAAAPPRAWLLADIATGQRLIGVGDSALDGPARPFVAAGAAPIDGVAMAITLQVPAWLRALDAIFPGLASQVAGADPVLDVNGWRAVPLGDAAERRFVAAILFNLGALSMLAAVVAGFLIYQSGVNAIRQRTLLLERLHAMGMPPGIARAHLAAEGLVLGAAGALLGVPAGWWLADLLALLVGGVVSGGDPAGALSPVLLVKVAVLGPGIGVAGMLLAQRTLARGHGPRRLRYLGVAVGLLALGAGIAWPESGSPGGFLAIAGLCVVAVSVLPALLRGVTGALLAWPGERGLLSLLNLRELRATLPDVQAAGAALTIALAAAIGIGLMVASLRGGFEGMLAQRLAADVTLETGRSSAGFRPQDRAALAAMPEVLALRHYRQAELFIAAADTAAGPIQAQIARLDDWELARYGQAGDFQPGTVYISEPAARAYRLGTGTPVSVEGPAMRAVFRVGGVFRDYGAARPRVLIDADDAATLGIDALPERLSLLLAPGADPAALRQRAAAHGWHLQTLAELRDLSARIFDRTFRISDALAALALVVALVGLYNALTALQIKRRAERRLLRGMGLDQRRMLRMGLAQSLQLAVLLVLIAIPVGIGIAALLCGVVNPRAFGWSIPLQLQLRPIIVPVSLGLVAAALAGALPAATAARTAIDDE